MTTPTKNDPVAVYLKALCPSMAETQRLIDTAQKNKRISMQMYTNMVSCMNQLTQYNERNLADCGIVAHLIRLDIRRCFLRNGYFNVNISSKGLINFIESIDMDHGGFLKWTKDQQKPDEIETILTQIIGLAIFRYGSALGKDLEYQQFLYLAWKRVPHDPKLRNWFIENMQENFMENRHFNKDAKLDELFPYLNPRPIEPTTDLVKQMAW